MLVKLLTVSRLCGSLVDSKLARSHRQTPGRFFSDESFFAGMKMRFPFFRAPRDWAEDPEKLRHHVIEISLNAMEALQRAYSLNQVDTSVFQEANIYKPLRESLGWSENDGWRRYSPRIAELKARLPETSEPASRKELLSEIIRLRYPSSEEQNEYRLDMTIRVFRWLHTHGLVHHVEEQWVLFAPSGVTSPAFEYIPSYEIPVRYVTRVLNSLVAEKSLERAERDFPYTDLK